MTDWYFAGIGNETFWALVGEREIKGRTAAQVLRPLVTEASEPDISWISKVLLLEALSRFELAFVIERRGEQVQWVLNPFLEPAEASGFAKTIGEAIDALSRASRIRHHAQWDRIGASLA
jgi:hypothetical protein